MHALRAVRLASLLALPAMAALAACMPLNLLDAGRGAGGGGGDHAGIGGGFGGAGAYTSTGTGTTGAGNNGSGAAPNPFDLGYLCGGSQATCSPDPGATDCTPGGNPNVGGASADGGAKLSCQLMLESGTVAAKCALAGDSAADGPCTQASDCEAGNGCGQVGVTGVCHAYCCDDPESCPTNTVCTATPMQENPSVSIPLCMPAVNCDLLSDGPMACPPGQTCAIMRNDGTRTCVPVGDGVAGDPCPCEAGYTCSPATYTCLKLCHTKSTVNTAGECGTGTCQGGTAQYPDGIGVCVGGG